MKKLTTFEVMYFNRHGKWYATAEFEAEATILDEAGNVYMEDAREYFINKSNEGSAPGLNGNGIDFHKVITHPDGYPIMIWAYD